MVLQGANPYRNIANAAPAGFILAGGQASQSEIPRRPAFIEKFSFHLSHGLPRGLGLVGDPSRTCRIIRVGVVPVHAPPTAAYEFRPR